MIAGLHHVGISVADLDRSVRFYRDVLGMEVVGQGEFSGERIERIVNLKGARGQVAFLRLGSLQLELFEYENPLPKPGNPNRPVCDHGITHFCIQVTDIHGEYARLNAAGVVFHCPPLAAQNIATYARDPDGNVFELLELSCDPHRASTHEAAP